MIQFRPLLHAHLMFITPLPVQTVEYEAMLNPAGKSVIESSLGLSAWNGSRCIGMAGVYQIWPGRAEAWILLGKHAGEHVPAIVRQSRFVLNTYPSRRIEIAVKTGNAEGQRLARLLGFSNPVMLECFHPDGSDVFMYARISRQWPL